MDNIFSAILNKTDIMHPEIVSLALL